MMTRIIFFLFLFFVQTAIAQETRLTLDYCQQEAQQNYPLGKGKVLLASSHELELDNLDTNWLPQLWLNGKASWQSDVPGVNFPGMDTPQAPKDQYSLGLDVEQLIYDGGRTRERKNVEAANNNVALQSLEVQLYELRKRVNGAYFSVLLMRKSRGILEQKREALKERLQEVVAAVKSGTALVANQKLLEAELLLVGQQEQELIAAEEAGLDRLAVLMGTSLVPGVELVMPEVELQLKLEQQRPEYLFYQNQREALDARSELIRKDRLPVLSGFGQLGYGNPGLKFLQDEFNSYYMIGARFRWNVFDWKKNKRKRKILDFQKDLIRTREESFTTNVNAELKAQMRKINQYEIVLEKDEAILSLREDVTKSAASQLENGVITSADYLEELDREVQARLNGQMHSILLLQAKSEYNRIVGKP